MKLSSRLSHTRYRGSILIISMIFLVIFSALVVSLGAMSNTNLQIAVNYHKANCARTCAESGHQVIRHWLSQVSIPGTTTQELRFNEITNYLQSAAYNTSNVSVSSDSSGISIPSIIVDSVTEQSFCAAITQIEPNELKVDVTGSYGSINKTISVDYKFAERANTVFDFALASKGPLSLTGNVELEDVNLSVDSSVYIESENSNLALSITGNSHISGDVSIVNSIASVYLQGGNAGIGGETGQAAIDNHVTFGVPPSEFPQPNPGYFEPYATNVVDANTDTSADTTFENIRVIAGTNPNFTGNITLNGIVFIETPNVVTFTGNTTITGIIVGNGDIDDSSGTNQINFSGNVTSYPVSELPDEEQFAQLRDETGTFLLAPGFSASFGGNFDSLNGSIAANGIEFYGNAGGIINGSLINYSDTEMEITGNSDLHFNRSGTSFVPAGFVPDIILQYYAPSYSETGV